MTKEMYEDLLERNRLQISELNTLTEEQDKHIVELEKENAELKEDNSEWEKASDKWKSVYELTNNQLTKAKELLERLLITSCNSDVLNLLPNCSEVLRVRAEAEQFLNSEVEK